MKYNLTQFQKDLAYFDLTLTDRQIEQFMMYYEVLIEKNKVMNLTSITEFDEVMKKHFVDSLSLVKAVDLNKTESLIDIGTGAGFPGIPLKIAFPDLEITLLDSLQKRVGFLQEVIDQLGLNQINAIHGRAEDFAKSGELENTLREKYDLCVSRAVANLAVLSEYCIPYVKVGGKFISYKSEKTEEECKDAEHAVSLLGGKIADTVSFELPDSSIYRTFVVIDKVEQTLLQYPRKAGAALKKPL